MAENVLLEVNQYFKCQRCGGQVLRSYEDMSCLQCGAIHTPDGCLMKPAFITEADFTGRRRNRSTPRNLMKLRPSKL